ncbi:hypothetical protein LPJ74_005571 [Coemansia sp. RSA 1843]|nr:hypothetical protein LPJ74_005571 [Coemansia sp. RSA 1843]
MKLFIPAAILAYCATAACATVNLRTSRDATVSFNGIMCQNDTVPCSSIPLGLDTSLTTFKGNRDYRRVLIGFDLPTNKPSSCILRIPAPTSNASNTNNSGYQLTVVRTDDVWEEPTVNGYTKRLEGTTVGSVKVADASSPGSLDVTSVCDGSASRRLSFFVDTDGGMLTFDSLQSAQLSGAQTTDERVQLVSETLSKTDSAMYEGLIDTAPLRSIMANIRTMHDAAPPEQRTAVLALVAGAFSGPELKQKWGFSFGTHQLQTAKRMSSDGSFANHLFEPHKRAIPPSRQPKPSDFVERLVQFVSKHTKDGEGNSNVLARPLRALHRDFVSKTAENKVSFSTFRALVLERFKLPGTEESAEDADIENEKDADEMQQSQQLPENPYDTTQPFSLNQGLEGLISSLDFSSLGMDPMYYRQQPVNLSLPSLQSLTAGVTQQPQIPSVSRISEIPTIQNLFDLASFNNNNPQPQPQLQHQQHRQHQQQQQQQSSQQQHDSDEERLQSSQFFYF